MTFEKQRLRTSSGKLPDSKIASLAASHPFTRQVDITFPFRLDLLESLQKLEAYYWKGKVRLYDVVNDGVSFATALGGKGNLLLVSHPRHEDDAWCIDPRAHLTICASKDTYERLGLVGQKVPFKNQSEHHLIDIPLGTSANSPKNLDKVKSAIQRWDERRCAKSGAESSWDVIYCLRDPDTSRQVLFRIREEQIYKVQSRKREMQNVHIPHISLDGPTNNDPDAADDWSQHLNSIFEWVGMACLGAQRLYANDRVDPFVAVYDPPSPYYVGKVMHLQWKGLLSPGFVQRVLDLIVNTIDSSISGPSFVAVTSHAMTSCPVSYIPSRQTELGETFHSDSTQIPLRLPREDGEDTWSLLLQPSPSCGSAKHVEWYLRESIGLYDNRWG